MTEHGMDAVTVVCNTVLSVTLFGIAAWAVFGRDESPWWFVGALLTTVALQFRRRWVALEASKK